VAGVSLVFSVVNILHFSLDIKVNADALDRLLGLVDQKSPKMLN
jgi:hypothetical protein